LPYPTRENGNCELLEAVELGFLLDLAEVLMVSACKESRGGHAPEDYQHRDDPAGLETDSGHPLSAGIRKY